MKSRVLRDSAVRVNLISVAFAGVSLLVGCSGGGSSGSASSIKGEAWTAPTTYRFESLDKRSAPKIEAVFQSRKVLYRRTGEDPLAYEIKGLRDPMQIARLNREIADASGQPFETATMNFGGLDPSATAYANIDIKVTPGAEAFVADGAANGSSPWRRVFVDKNGSWKGLINSRGMVQKQGGWLYVAATKDNLTRYSRVNVTTRTSEALSFTRFKDSNLPVPGVAGKGKVETAETTTDKAGFKWPWE
jgi:hypothetical protein